MKPVKKTKKARFLQWKPTRIKELKNGLKPNTDQASIYKMEYHDEIRH